MTKGLHHRIGKLEKTQAVSELSFIMLTEAGDEAGLSADEILDRRGIKRPPNSIVTIMRYRDDGRSGPEYVEGGQNVYVQFPPKLAGFFERVPETSEMAIQWDRDAKRQPD